MANRIKGITVEIGGDTTKLSKALEGVNKNIKNTQTQLKDVQKLLKLDPSNTELISQKHKLLADALKATKEKLETLKTAAEQANQALANGDISQEQYDALQREIIEKEQELQNLQREAEASSTALAKLGQAGEMLEKAGDKIADVGTTLTTHVTFPVMAAGTAAVKTAADFDSAMSKVAAVSGATGDELDALRDKAREMGAKTKFSASEAADAMNYMAMAGWKTGELGLCTHFTGFVTQCVQFITSRTGYSSDLRHCRIEIRCCFYGGCTRSRNGNGHMGGQCCSDISDFIASLFEHFTRLTEFGKSRTGSLRLTLEVLQLLFRFDDLTLEGIVLLLRNVAVGESRVCLFRSGFQGFQLFFGSRHRIGEELMLLREQFRIGRIELQQLLNILELRLRVLDVFIDTFQCLRQLGRIAADLDGDALDSVCHAVSPTPP